MVVDAPKSDDQHRYAAFISYRHVEPDRKWARWLHGALETYRVPKQLVGDRATASRVGRVFRDEEELPASADLNAEIESALEQSRFLIVVCSRRTPESEWVNKEVLRFRELGRDQRILALLVDGEPHEAFPRALCEIRRTITDAHGRTVEELEEIEPLAADVRRFPTRRESPRHLKRMARLRILACILGCRFDDLRKRDHERRVRRLLQYGVLMTVLFATMLILSVVAFYEKGEADRQRKAAQTATENETFQRENAERRLYNAQALHLATASTSQRLVDPEVSLLLAIESVNATVAHGQPILPQSRRSLVECLSTVGGYPVPSWRPIEGTRSGPWLITGDDRLRLWQVAGRDAPLEKPFQSPENVWGLTLAQGAHRLVALDRQGAVYIWDLKDTSTVPAPTVLKWPARFPFSHMLHVSADGHWIVLDAAGPSVVWDTSDLAHPKHRIGLQPPESRHRLRFSPDGRLLITAGSDNTVRLWRLDAESIEAPVHELKGHTSELTDIALTSDGAWLISTSYDRSVRMWSLRDDDPQRSVVVLKGHQQAVRSCVISPDNKWFATIGDDDFALLWQVNGGEFKQLCLSGHLGSICRVAFSAKSDRLLTAGQDGSIRIWDLHRLASQPSVAPTTVLTGHEVGYDIRYDWRTINSVFFLRDGRRVVSGGYDQTVRVWDVDTQNPSQSQYVLRGHSAPIRSVVPIDDESWLASQSIDGKTRLWDLRRRRFSAIHETIPAAARRAEGSPTLAVSPTGRWIAAATGKSVGVWDLATGVADQPTLSLDSAGAFYVDFVADSRLFVGGLRRHFVYDLSALEPKRLIASWEASRPVLNMASCQEGRRIATFGLLGDVQVWDLRESPKLVATLPLSNPVLRMRLSPDGAWLATASAEGAFLWKLNVPIPSASAVPLTWEKALSMEWSVDGSLLAVGTDRGNVLVWDFRAQAPPLKPRTYSQTDDNEVVNAVTALAISPRGTMLASGGVDAKVRVWNLAGRNAAPMIVEGQSGVGTVLFAADGGSLASISDMQLSGSGGDVRIWDLARRSQQPEAILPVKGGLSVKASRDLTVFAGLNDAQAVVVWRIDMPSLLRQAQRTAGRRLNDAERERFSLTEEVQGGTAAPVDSAPSAASFATDISAQLNMVFNAELRAREESQRRLDRVGHLTALVQAFQLHHDEHHTLLPSAVVGPDGKTIHSWRVALLPKLGLHSLYREYRLEEPWDSEHNRRLLDKMPAVFRHPGEDGGSRNACCFVIVGEDPKQRRSFANVTDGLSNTILLIEAKRDVPWTKPDDIVFSKDGSMPSLQPFEGDEIFACCYDGAAVSFSSKLDPAELKAWLTMDGGEMVTGTGVTPVFNRLESSFYPPLTQRSRQ